MNLIQLDFEQAKTRHILFKTRLRSLLYGASLDDSSVVSAVECPFGKWLHDHALQVYSHIPATQALQQTHNKIHFEAKSLLELYKNGKIDEAREGLLRIDELSHQVVEILLSIEKQVLQENKEKTTPDNPQQLWVNCQELLELHQTIQQLDDQIKQQTFLAHKIRKEADQNARKFLNTVRQAPVGITILRGNDFIVEMANETYLQIIDRKEETFVGRSLFDSLPEVKDIVEPLLRGVIETGQPAYGHEFEVEINRFDNKERTFFNFVYQPLYEPNGNIDGVIVVANEVTKQVEAKFALQQSEAQFRNIINQSPIAMTIFRGRDLVIELANQTMLKNVWRRELVEVQGRKLLDVFPELVGQKYPQLLLQVFEDAQTHQEKESLAYVDSHDGRQAFYLDFEYAPLFDTSHEVAGIMVTVYDVTEKVQSRQKIKEAEEHLRMAVGITGLGTFEVELASQQMGFSKRFLEIFGFEPNDSPTRATLVQRIHPHDLAVRQAAHETSMRKGILEYEARVIHPDQSIHWVIVKGKVLFDHESKPFRLLGTVLDVTEEKVARHQIEQSEKQLRELAESLELNVARRTQELKITNEQLAKSNDELAQFAYVASHDLQEPLRKIQAFSSRILEYEWNNLSLTGQDYFRRIQSASKRMQQLILDLLAYSRASATDQSFEETDLSVMLKTIFLNLQEEINQKNASIEFESLPTLKIIRFQFEQLFTNLISNALKFSQKGTPPHIHIEAKVVASQSIHSSTPLVHPHYHCLTVSDNGIGFEEEFTERIFQVFQRLHGRDTYEGTGIGLAICKKIVENHDGFITAHSQPNQGATFYIYLPVE